MSEKPQNVGQANRVPGRAGLLADALTYFAEHGIEATSLRQLASALGTSHRMLIYHFGSRDGLLAAVVEELEARERETLRNMGRSTDASLVTQGLEFWRHVIDTSQGYGPLYFELAARAMRSTSTGTALRIPNIERWLAVLGDLWTAAGLDDERAVVRARLNLAVSRGLLHDYLLTRDRGAVDAAMTQFVDLTFDQRGDAV